MRPRIITLFILIGAVAYAPWWLSVLLALGAMWRFGSGYELLLPAAIADLAYGAPSHQFFGLAFPATWLLAGLVAMVRMISRHILLFK